MSNLALKPIETKYRGYRFRSRLEARWAVFFDLMGMQWEYEPEGFEFMDPSGCNHYEDCDPGGCTGGDLNIPPRSLGEKCKPRVLRYLPDFKVYTPQGQHAWYEVKPGNIKEYGKFEKFKASLLCEENEYKSPRASLLSGDPMDAVKMERESYAHYSTNICPRCGLIGGSTHFGEGTDALDYLRFYGCQPCDYETPSGKGNGKERGVLGIEVEPYKGNLDVDDLNVERFARAVIKATQAARAARFEHGECG